MNNEIKTLSFVQSLLTQDNPLMSTEDVIKWIDLKRTQVKVNINEIKFSELKDWYFDNETGNLKHNSGKFFSIDGIKVKTNWGLVSSWEQPIINQPEVGILGIITKKINGILYFLLQAKIEPGNINVVQLSPTLQATKSNYTAVHKGRKPYYLEYFNGGKKVDILINQLQSEQGARFYKKRNRNIIVEISENIPVYDDFCWLTLGQIKLLLNYDNIVNMDTRTVISCINLGLSDNNSVSSIDSLDNSKTLKNKFSDQLLESMLYNNNPLYNTDDIISWITTLKTKFEIETEFVGLNKISNWEITDYSIKHKMNKYFSVIAVDIEIESREVKKWGQPLMKPAQEGLIAFIVKKFNNTYHFLVQAKLEAGNLDIIELAPTVQCLTGNYRKGMSEYYVPFLDLVLEAKKDDIRHLSFQSEEGGRFYKEQVKQMVVEVYEDFDINVPETYIWMTLEQLNIFNKFNNYLNIQARSLLSAVPFL
jgi:dTDP-4-dehydro-6-deoxy-alpha-D-glucopyranose 2,3-dehydratase